MAEQLGRYILDRKIAAGGMAEVFLARQPGPGGFEKVCVIKRMLPSLCEDEQFVRMFLDEAKLAAYLNHAHIAQIFDFGQLQGTYYLAMEYVPGSTLRQIVKDHTKRGVFLPVHLVARIVAQAAIALDYAHGATDSEGNPLNIIHRDVSPQNILLGTTGVVKLIDFGVAKAASASVKTATGMIKGKFAYMSPEQLRGKPLDRRSDVYGLGFVLYELLAGSRAIQGVNDAAMMDAALKRKFDPIEARRPDVPAPLRDIVMKALAKEREDRYASCADMSADLERFLIVSGHAVTGRDLVELLSEDARTPLRLNTGELPSAQVVVAERASGTPVSLPSSAFWEDPQGSGQNQRTIIDASFLPGGATKARPSSPTLVVPPSDRSTLKEPHRAVKSPENVTIRKPIPELGGRTPSAPSQQAAIAPAADESRSSLTRRAAIQRTLAPFVVAAVAVVAVLGGLGYMLFSEDEAPPLPPLTEKPIKPVPVVLPPKVEEPVEVVDKTPVILTPPPVDVEEKKPPIVEKKPPVVEKKPPIEEKKPPVVVKRPPAKVTPPPSGVVDAKATLTINSSPPTTIWLDGVSVGRTPLQTQVAAGDHQLLFRDDKLGLRHSRQIRVEKGDSRREEWRAGKGKVAFRVVPFGEVYLGKDFLGLTPLTPVELYEGEYTFKFVNKDTGRNEMKDVKVVPDKETVVKVDLRPGS